MYLILIIGFIFYTHYTLYTTHIIEIPRFDITINTTQITESTVTIYWKVVNDGIEIDHLTGTENQLEREKEWHDYVINNISDVFVTIYSLEVEDLSFKSPAFRNVTRGEYLLTNLQGKMKYNVCVIVRTTNKDVGEVNRCVGVKTGRYNNGRDILPFCIIIIILHFFFRINTFSKVAPYW